MRASRVLETTEDLTEPAETRTRLPASPLDSQQVRSVIRSQMNWWSHQYHDQDRPPTQWKHHLPKDQSSEHKIQLVHDRKRTPWLYPDTSLEKGAKQIPENRPQRDHKAPEQETSVYR